MIKLCFDYGHGGEDPGATYNGRKESDDVLAIGKEVAKEVRNHGVIVDETRTNDATVSLNDRSAFENRSNYDYFISFHRNAYKPESARGVEAYTYLNPGVKSQSLSRRIQDCLVSLGFIDRGVKTADYHVLRETKAAAVLIEIGFIDNTDDNDLFDEKRNEIVKVLAKAILMQVGVNYVDVSAPTKVKSSQTLYRVMSGSYSSRENAEKQVQKLNASGFDAAIMIVDK